MSDWRDIETAPKDGTEILLCDDRGRRRVGMWFKEIDTDVWEVTERTDFREVKTRTVKDYSDWVAFGDEYFNGHTVKYWMPLPNPPPSS